MKSNLINSEIQLNKEGKDQIRIKKMSINSTGKYKKTPGIEI